MSGAVEAVGDFIGGIGDAVGSVVEFVGDTVGGMVESFADNPLRALPMAVAAYFSGGTTMALDATGEAAFWAADAAAMAETGLSAAEIASVLQADYGLSAATAAQYAVSGTTMADMAWDAASMLEQGLGQAQVADTLASTYGITPAQASFYALPIEAQNAYIQSGVSPSYIGEKLLQTAKVEDAFYALPADAQSAYITAGYSPYEIGSALVKDASSTGLFGNVRTVQQAVDAAKTLFQQPSTTAGLLGGAMNTLGGYLQSEKAVAAAQDTAKAQVLAAQIAADAAKFRPVGVTTAFGSSKYGYDANGNLVSAGYQLNPATLAQQQSLLGLSDTLLSQYAAGQGAAIPMGEAGKRAMQLGQGYLGADPAAQAKMFYDQQQALLAPTRERQYSDLETRLLQQGRLGLATGGTSTLGAANPELEALMNAQRMQDLQLAANATQGGMDYAKFGAGMVGTGGDLLKGMYGTQAAAFAPYQTAIGGASMLEQLGQNAMDLGTSIGAKTSTAAANAGQLTAQGMLGAAQTNQAAAYSPWASLLAGGANAINTMNQPKTVYVNPLTGQPMNWGV